MGGRPAVGSAPPGKRAPRAAVGADGGGAGGTDGGPETLGGEVAAVAPVAPVAPVNGAAGAPPVPYTGTALLEATGVTNTGSVPPAIAITPPHTEHRARTPVAGTFAGSTRNTDRHSGHATVIRHVPVSA